MTKPFNELRKKMSPASQTRADALTKKMLAEMPLYELRQAMNLTQEKLASTLNVKQATVSKLERRTDMYISTLARFVEAMGGELEVRARFQNGDVKINSLEGLNSEVAVTLDSNVHVELTNVVQRAKWEVSMSSTPKTAITQTPRPALGASNPTAMESITTPSGIQLLWAKAA